MRRLKWKASKRSIWSLTVCYSLVITQIPLSKQHSEYQWTTHVAHCWIDSFEVIQQQEISKNFVLLSLIRLPCGQLSVRHNYNLWVNMLEEITCWALSLKLFSPPGVVDAVTERSVPNLAGTCQSCNCTVCKHTIHVLWACLKSKLMWVHLLLRSRI